MIALSIIIPVYNCEKYIYKCVQSIGCQNKEIEIILVNDGSTDRSGDICSSIASKYKNIILLSQENAGVASARNLGTSHAHGNFIWYIDADDYIGENAVEEILQIIKEEDSVDFISFNSTTVFQKYSVPNKRIEKKEYLNKTQALETALYSDKLSFSACDKVFRRSFLGTAPFPSGIPMGEEQIAMSHFISKVNTVLLLPKNYYYYVQRASSESHFPEKAHVEKMNLLYDTYYNIAQKLIKNNPSLESAINARLIFQRLCIIGWMARSKTCDKKLGRKITKTIRTSLYGYWKNRRVKLSLKAAAALASIHYKLVYFAYRIILLFRSTSNLVE